MEHFVNPGHDLVVEALDGALMAAGAGHLARLDGLPDIKVVVRADRPGDEVAVISGGGSGHEPAHGGFVGPGLLSAAVCGDIFASPSVEAVLAAIRAVTGSAGCLLVVKNYTGDRLTFGLAAERAKLEGFDVAMVVVADDVAIPEAPQPRGLAGTLFVHKVAGALAAAGRPLATVAGVAREAAASVRTLGVAVSGAAIPGRPAEVRLAAGEAELGLGIHGEPGVEVVRLADVASLVALMAERLEAAVGRGPVAVLANNLGGVTGLEMAVILREFLDCPLGRRAELVVGPAALMTSMAMKGFSLSVLPLDDERRDALRAPSAPWTAWPGARPLRWPDTYPLTQPAAAAAPPSAHPPTRAALATIGQCLVAAEADLNALDAKVGDGDTGSTLAAAGRRVLDALDTLPLAEPARLCGELATLMATSVGGSSGVLLAVFCTAAASACGAGAAWTAALQRGAEAIQMYGGASEGDRTMLDALLPALRALSSEGSDAEGLCAAADAARAGADATAGMARARAGRSSYVGAAHLRGVADPGAEAVARLFAALAGDAS